MYMFETIHIDRLMDRKIDIYIYIYTHIYIYIYIYILFICIEQSRHDTVFTLLLVYDLNTRGLADRGLVSDPTRFSSRRADRGLADRGLVSDKGLADRGLVSDPTPTRFSSARGVAR